MNDVIPTDFNIHLFHEGNFFEAFRMFGAHRVVKGEGFSTSFCVWAPKARSVSVVGSFNDWQSNGYECRKLNREGIWFLEIGEDLLHHTYKYEIVTAAGEIMLKSDPFSFFNELRPNTASIVSELGEFEWTDEEWLVKKSEVPPYDSPMFIYEVHLGTWRKNGGGDFLSYREMAAEIIPHVVSHGFTHIELLPVIEHPYDRSWGYQGTGYFAPTSRYGSPADLKHFINECHAHGIGVILDWVPGHFCKDSHGLYRFDGSFMYDYAHEHDRENYTWGTANFDLGKGEVQSFLISSARFWMEEYHVDGFRVDAVANIIYRANQENNSVNHEGIAFLKKLNKSVFEFDPHTLMIAEDSTDWPQVTSPVHYGGLGFNYKWNMGWMNDVLKYMESQPSERHEKHSLITFSLLYAFTENYILPFSHDEVVHGKRSLLDKMPGDYWQKFAQLKLLLGFMTAHPGKKLLFMGTEVAQFSEWKDLGQVDWHLMEFQKHQEFNSYIKELLHLYKRSPSLYEQDHRSEGFEWVDVNNASQQIFSFIRKAEEPEDHMLIICNFSPAVYHHYKVGVLEADGYREIWNSDHHRFGGSNQINPEILTVKNESYHGKPCYVEMTIPPYAAVYLRPIHRRKGRIKYGKVKLCRNVVSRREGQQVKFID
ncbi:1,4-alpha-glucan branching enzyme [Bacillus salacetis]|uniref:1,4-alpha-glucan branching enzyme GlgB n=1 Tax=Bacillus salacetis TaxID=2315464 RepID=A0A3A1R1W2_9BACI|nr:1,4-alpha-glucan branching enzyme [Bacillus salacetis]RIW35612.1 1,4-alpha-glucan branching enzyme [Bacillus salacetis]